MLANHLNEIGFSLINAECTHTSESSQYGVCLAFDQNPEAWWKCATFEYKIESGFASVFLGHHFTRSEKAILDYHQRLVEIYSNQIDRR